MKPGHTARECAVVELLQAKWNCELRRLADDMQVRYASVRDGRTALAFVQVVIADEPWADMPGVTMPSRVWKAASGLCALSQLPFIVAAECAGDIRFARLATVTPDYQGDAPGVSRDRFRPVGSS